MKMGPKDILKEIMFKKTGDAQPIVVIKEDSDEQTKKALSELKEKISQGNNSEFESKEPKNVN